ncbi:addiction module protein [bacterium]|nr:addiction module protein [bacterium]
MTREARELLERALKLPVKERGKLAKRLLESCDEEETEDPAEVEKAWAEEIKRRVREIDEGRVKGIPHEEVMAHVRDRLKRARKRRKG